MQNLKDVTFIIPVRIESPDRKENAEITLNYLCKHLLCNIIILEHDTTPKIPNILKSVDRKESKINYHFLDSKNQEIFHRTRFLNMMLNMVNTPVVVNYDVDVLLKPEVYFKCKTMIREGMDLVYPYFWGNSQHQVFYPGRGKIKNGLPLDKLVQTDTNLTRSEFGHCQFFNTKSYLTGGMENENFISYAPEDQERGYRFKKLGYKVSWSTDFVYHMEHTRGVNSSSNNPMMEHNNRLFDTIKTLDDVQLKDYYQRQEYIKRYNNRKS